MAAILRFVLAFASAWGLMAAAAPGAAVAVPRTLFCPRIFEAPPACFDGSQGPKLVALRLGSPSPAREGIEAGREPRWSGDGGSLGLGIDTRLPDLDPTLRAWLQSRALGPLGSATGAAPWGHGIPLGHGVSMDVGFLPTPEPWNRQFPPAFGVGFTFTF